MQGSRNPLCAASQATARAQNHRIRTTEWGELEVTSEEHRVHFSCQSRLT